MRVNILNPRALSDQHLIAEYSEILMLFGYVRKHPGIKSEGTHFMKMPVKFFSNKLAYLVRRHGMLRQEMKRRGFKHGLSPNLEGYSKKRFKEFAPNAQQVREIKSRIINRLLHPPRRHFYRYERRKVPTSYLVALIKKSKPI